MKCELCGRENMSPQELAIHRKYFHTDRQQGAQAQIVTSGTCPDCGSTLFMQEGCVKCQSCGYTKCG